jgi:hypothetical protein
MVLTGQSCKTEEVAGICKIFIDAKLVVKLIIYRDLA